MLSSGLKRANFLKLLDHAEKKFVIGSWHLTARENQRPKLIDWRTWLFLGGRGAGKTRSGSEYIKGLVTNNGLYPGDTGGRIALVGSTFADVRDVMIEGESGILSIWGNRDRPIWISSKRQLEWPCGTIATALSASDPEQLRGHQFGFAWSDEFCKWPYLETTWNMLQFCLRLGTQPKQIVTTTPRALSVLKSLLKDKSTVISRSTTAENAINLAPGFVEYLTGQYDGTRLGRQELYGEFLEDREDSLWNRAMIEQLRLRQSTPLNRVVVAVDPPATSGGGSAACGIVAAGKNGAGKCYVLRDATIENATPSKWANCAVKLYHEMNANCIVAETNQGGEMVKTIIQTADPTVPVKMVHATRGKWLRAEPVAHLYERSAVAHVGSFPELEDQMCDFGPDGLSSGKSPDRLDALVWAVTDLALASKSVPRVRGI